MLRIALLLGALGTLYGHPDMALLPSHTRLLFPLNDANTSNSLTMPHEGLLSPEESRIQELQHEVSGVSIDNAVFELEALRNMSQQIVPKTYATTSFAPNQLRDSLTVLHAHTEGHGGHVAGPCDGVFPHPSTGFDPCHAHPSKSSPLNSLESSEKRKLLLRQRERQKEGLLELRWRHPVYQRLLRGIAPVCC